MICSCLMCLSFFFFFSLLISFRSSYWRLLIDFFFLKMKPYVEIPRGEGGIKLKWIVYVNKKKKQIFLDCFPAFEVL
jgi:hypothetical protein